MFRLAISLTALLVLLSAAFALPDRRHRGVVYSARTPVCNVAPEVVCPDPPERDCMTNASGEVRCVLNRR